MLSFVKHVLEDASMTPDKNRSVSKENTAAKPWLLVPEAEPVNDLDEGDSDDDTPGSEIISPDDEMKETSINLLLSILEGEFFGCFSNHLCSFLYLQPTKPSQRGHHPC